MWIQLLCFLLVSWLFSMREAFGGHILSNKCNVTRVDPRYTGPLPMVYDICIPFAKYGFDNTLSVINTLVMMANSDRVGSFSVAPEYGSNANIVYLQERNLIMINPRVSIESLQTSSVKCKVKFHNAVAAQDYETFAVGASVTFYNQEFKWQNMTLGSKEVCWLKLYLNSIELNKSKKL